MGKDKGSFLSEHMESLAASILAQCERARKGSTHPGTKGAAIEVVLRHLLQQYVPTLFSVGYGQCANVEGKISPQLDVLLYARSQFPHLAVNEDGSVVVCSEAVLSVVECKTQWRADKVKRHFDNFRDVENAREGFWWGSESARAGYFVFVIDDEKQPDLREFGDSTRAVGVYSLAGKRAWHSPGNTADFTELTGNALEFVLNHILEDCLRKGPGEMGSLAATYEVVAKYFGWAQERGCETPGA